MPKTMPVRSQLLRTRAHSSTWSFELVQKLAFFQTFLAGGEGLQAHVYVLLST